MPGQHPSDQLGERDPRHHEVALLVGAARAVGRVDVAQAARQEDPDGLAAHAGRGVEVDERVPLRRPDAGLLDQLALRGRPR